VVGFNARLSIEWIAAPGDEIVLLVIHDSMPA